MAARKRSYRYRIKKGIKYKIQAAITLLGCLILLSGFVNVARMVVAPHYLGADTSYIDGIPVYTDYLDPDWRGRTEVHRRIRYLVIHETGNTEAGADAELHNRYLHSAEQKDTPLSWHYTVDDHQIYHHLPDDERGYHASDTSVDGGGNECGIGIEICVNADGDYDKAVDNTAHLAADLLKRYHLSLDDVKQHGDFTSKNCPEHLREGDNYAQFLEKIKTYM